MTDEILTVTRWWACPHCGAVGKTTRGDAHSQMHQCPGMGGLVAPLVEVSSPDEQPAARHVPVEREDYIGDEIGVSRVMAVRTERKDGSHDTTVFAPTASLSVEMR